jgi:gamma-glutamylcyclotransferase (GGCT)/AIG2-like uncharacterized protein YtfP
MTKDETRKFFIVANGLFPALTIQPGTVEGWCMVFERESLETMIAALRAHALDSKFPPTPADIQHMIEAAREPERPSSAEALLIAKSIVGSWDGSNKAEREQIRRETHPAVTRAIRAIGFDRLDWAWNWHSYDPNANPATFQDTDKINGQFIKAYEQILPDIDHRKPVERLQGSEVQALLGNVNKAIGGGLKKILTPEIL